MPCVPEHAAIGGVGVVGEFQFEPGIVSLSPSQAALWGFRSGERGTHTRDPDDDRELRPRDDYPWFWRGDELDGEQQRSVKEGLKEHELALFDLLTKDELAKAERERVKQASRELLASITARLSEFDRFWEKEQTKAEVEVFILDEVYANLPTPPFTTDEKKTAADAVYAHVWQQAVSGEFARVA